MIAKPFEPTEEQRRVIEQAGSTFVAACPGAGKTLVMVERARKRLGGGPTGRGMVFPSFTIAAVSELEDRLRRERLIETGVPAFYWDIRRLPLAIPHRAVRRRWLRCQTETYPGQGRSHDTVA
ncbi:UvrD-helicase domain-containing protein [Bradyrhizobium sp. ERR14]|uniref:UvrD-helicase domain-containing protein n=1 Tax=Bradyrhizobium sp. ERR14 TaxID=2663837 RepID=UPI001617F964|nr:UvrD-helicase domain-containing protein [Bradyrhizobium sp. ERR14]MBB4399241.1 hypothetical protein [Bradyrhizobium sp. ERR14]